jgi:hypothetical protein
MTHLTARARRVTAATLALGALLIAAAPVAATHPQGRYGTIGPVTWADTQAASSVSCVNTTTHVKNGIHYTKLTTLEVRAPMVRPAEGIGAQEVGWRFIVQRHPSSDWSLTGGSWVTTYKSPVQKAAARIDSDAPFTGLSVNVTVPRGNIFDDYSYDVLGKVYWYDDQGRVTGWDKVELSYYDLMFEGRLANRWPNYCAGHGRWTGWPE